MPTIPKAERTVKRQPLRTVQQQGASSAAPFGAAVGAAVSSLGEEMRQGELEELAAQNKTRAREIDTQFRKSLSDLQYNSETGYYNKRGKHAFEGNDHFNASTEELYKMYMEQAENDSQRELLDNVMRARIGRAQDSASSYATREYKNWQDTALKSSIEADTNEAVLNYNNPQLLRELKVSARSKILEFADSQGITDGKQIDGLLDTFESNIHEATVERILQDSPAAARMYYEENEKYITNKGAQASLLRKIKIAERGDLATNLEHYSELNKMAAFETEKFIGIDLNKYELSTSHYTMFDNAKRSAQLSRSKHNDKMAAIKRTMQLSSIALKSAGINTTPKPGTKAAKRLNEFQGALLIEIQQFRDENNDRAPNDIETRKIVGGLLQKGNVPGSGWFGSDVGRDEKFLFESEEAIIDIDSIDDIAKDKIRAAYKRKYNREPTNEEIEITYTKYIRSDRK